MIIHKVTRVASNTWGVILRSWRNVCRWVDEHLPETAIFLTPTTHQTFKWYGQRAEVVNWKDVPQDAENLIEWTERLQRVVEKPLTHDLSEGAAVIAAQNDNRRVVRVDEGGDIRARPHPFSRPSNGRLRRFAKRSWQAQNSESSTKAT